MAYTRLFQQQPFNSPLTGLRQSGSCWRSVIHICRNTKISSKRLWGLACDTGLGWPICYRQPCRRTDQTTWIPSFPSKIFRGTITQCRLNRNRTDWPCTTYKYSGTIRRNLSAAACMNYTSPATARIMTALDCTPYTKRAHLEEILALRHVWITLRQQLHECLSPGQGRVVGQLLK